jgi:hypothetical protein
MGQSNLLLALLGQLVQPESGQRLGPVRELGQQLVLGQEPGLLQLHSGRLPQLQRYPLRPERLQAGR